MQFNNMNSLKELYAMNLILGELDDTTSAIDYMQRGLNYEELKNYIELKINMQEIKDEKITYYPFGFRKCTNDDYIRNGIKIIESDIDIRDKLCPDVPESEENYKVKNAYVNSKDRNSFAIMIEKCDKTRNANCKNDTEINKLLKLIYFTTFTVV